MLFGVISVAGTGASAQDFRVFGKGVEIQGLVYTQTGSEPHHADMGTASGKLLVKAGFLVGTAATCYINGIPTDVGELYAWGRSYSQSFVCDPERIGTATARQNWGPRQIRYTTTTTVTGNVVTLNSSWTLATTLSIDIPGLRQNRSIRSTGKRTLRIRLEDRKCTVLAYSDQMDNIEEKEPGSPRRESTSKRISNCPSTTRTFID